MKLKKNNIDIIVCITRHVVKIILVPTATNIPSNSVGKLIMKLVFETELPIICCASCLQ